MGAIATLLAVGAPEAAELPGVCREPLHAIRLEVINTWHLSPELPDAQAAKEKASVGEERDRIGADIEDKAA
jgi:hypothetical protein